MGVLRLSSYFFVKNGKILSQTSLSSRLTRQSRISPKDSYADQISWNKGLVKQTKNLSADGVYMLPNHPSCEPTP